MSCTPDMVFDIMECTARMRGYEAERIEVKVENVVGIKIDGVDVFLNLRAVIILSADDLIDLIEKKLEPFPLKKLRAA